MLYWSSPYGLVHVGQRPIGERQSKQEINEACSYTFIYLFLVGRYVNQLGKKVV